MKSVSSPLTEVRSRARNLVMQMTTEEKARLCGGRDFWTTYGVERLGLKPVMVTDGPHGLRKQEGRSDHLGLNRAVPATCFPPACAAACSFDPDLMEELGSAMGEECRQEQVAVLLGPGVNIKRSPLGGRNFEYFSEDPLLAGRMAAAMIRGVQSQNVGTSLKHFFANNQEKARLTSNSVIDERAMREIYLTAFEIAVRESQPWTIMCAYNQINGTYASDNKPMMTDIPRGEWGYEGLIVTDWGAMNDRVQAIRAGLDLEMPGPCPDSEKKILAAVEDGSLTMEELNTCAERVTALLLLAERNTPTRYDAAAHDALAGRAARESAVLLKRGSALPVAKDAKIAVVGAFAKEPRYQGSGSSKINPHRVTSLCDALDAREVPFVWAAGYDGRTGETDEAMLAEAVDAARGADVVFACIGLPDNCESEGFDRTHLELPAGQNALMEALLAVGTPVVAVVSTGSVVTMPWREQVDSILLLYLAGQNGGTAAAELLLGEASPCGKLAETWPLALEDCPCGEHFACEGNVEYRESIYVGYRYYDKAEKAVAYPFGHGLSYTEFAYSDLTLSGQEYRGEGTVQVSCTVTNIGKMAGAEIVQLYIAPPSGAVFKPVRELRDHAKVFLAPGESRTVSFRLTRRSFAYYNPNISDWFVESGAYRIELGASSRDIRLSAPLTVYGDRTGAIPDHRESAPAYYDLKNGFSVPKEQFEALLGEPVRPWRSARPFTRNSTLKELECCEDGKRFAAQIRQGLRGSFSDDSDLGNMMLAMLEEMPLRHIAMTGGGQLTLEQVDTLLDRLNGSV